MKLKKLLLGLCLAQAVSAEPYRNPVLPFQERELADPHVLKYNGQYYLYTSGDPITAYQSSDLVHWKGLGGVLKSTPGTWNEADVWAPEVVYRNGTFYMFYTASRKSDDWRVQEMARRIGVATSSSPTGPFTDSGAPLFDGWGIDGTVYLDPRDGREYLYFSQLEEPEYPGAAIAVVPLRRDDATHRYRIEGIPQTVLRGISAWEDKDGDPNNGSLRYTNEGPTVFERDGKVYLLYSAGSWDQPTYAVGYATAAQPLGPFTRVEPPILKATPLVDGPGHAAVVLGPNNLELMHVYHARTQPYIDAWNRMPFVDRLDWVNDRLVARTPSLAWLEPPPLPQTREPWEVPPQAVVEVNFRGAARLQLGETVYTPSAAPGVFHQVLLRRDGERVQVLLDGVRAPELRWRGPGTLALSGAEFAGVSVSAGWNTQSNDGWKREGDLSWRADSPPADHYEFTLNLRPDDPAPPLVARPGPTDQKWLAGMLAARDDRGRTVTVGYDKAIWPLGRLKISDPTGHTQLVGLPRGFRYDQFHSLRVRRYQDAFTFFLDGREMASGRYLIGPSQVGTLSRGVRSDFREIAYQRLNAPENLVLNGGFEGEGDAWVFGGGARYNESSPHSGGRRLLLRGTSEARQTLLLQPGDYLLHCFLIGTAGEKARLTVNGQSTAVPMQGQWQGVDLPFQVVQAGPQSVSLQVQLGADSYVAADDFYLGVAR